MKALILAAVREISRTAMTFVHLAEAADGGVSAVFRTAGILDAINHHNTRTLAFLLIFFAYDWIRSGDNFARVVRAIRECFKEQKH